MKMLKAALIVTIACVAIQHTVYAQVADGNDRPAESNSADRVGVRLKLDLDPLTLWPVKEGKPATRPGIRSDGRSQTPKSHRTATRTRSKTRIAVGAIAGSVGGFFAGGFLGAHIEGDRCDCDDPGVRGFLIGAPIGALAGGLLGAKFLF